MIIHPGIKKIHFIGIAGTGMSGVAHLLYRKNYEISGSDQAFYPPMGDFLRSLPFTLYEGFSPNNIHQAKPDIIIVGNAISRGNPELEEALLRRIPLLSMPEAMRLFFLIDSRNIVVTGTHGKTTTTSLIAHLLQEKGYDASFLVGGIPLNFGTPSRLNNPYLFVLEGDEYDSAYFDKSPKFMKYLPHFLVINNIEFDHADIYSNLDEIKKQFYYASRLVPSNGLIIANGDDENVMDILKETHARVVTFGQNDHNDFIFNISQKQHKWYLEANSKEAGSFMVEIPFPMSGLGYNMTASIIAARYWGLKNETITLRMSTFKGVARRLQLLFENHRYTIYDDFAHHPTAVKVTLEAVKAKFPQKKVVAIFEPRSNTSIRNIFTHEYADALKHADMVFLAPPYQKMSQAKFRKLDVQTIQQMLVRSGIPTHIGKDYQELLELIHQNLPSSGILVLMSNGSFEPFKSRLLAIFK
jgi:UDP-N-acetylmuramate: L-alanyl-gamma-D-glutamyl-meso-diaminopimelate ligase